MLYSNPQYITGWWFGTFGLFFHILGIMLPFDFHIFQRGRYTTNQIKVRNIGDFVGVLHGDPSPGTSSASKGRCKRPWQDGWFGYGKNITWQYGFKKQKKMSGPTPDSLCWKPGKHHDVGKNVFLRKTISLGNGNVKFGFYSRPLELRTIFWQSHFSNNVQCYGNLDWQENMQHIRMYYWKFILMWLVVWNMFYFSIYCE